MFKRVFFINYWKFIFFWTFLYSIGFFFLQFGLFFDDAQLKTVFFFEVSIVDVYPLFFVGLQVLSCGIVSEYYDYIHDLGIDSGHLMYCDLSIWDDPTKVGHFEGLVKRDHWFIIFFNVDYLTLFYWMFFPCLIFFDLIWNLYFSFELKLDGLAILSVFCVFAATTLFEDDDDVSLNELFDPDDAESLDHDNIESSARWLFLKPLKDKISYQKNQKISRYCKTKTNPVSWKKK